jgi:hypothetical protein
VAAHIATSVPIDLALLDRAERGTAIYRLRLAIGALDEALKLSTDSSNEGLTTARRDLAARLAAARLLL